MQVTAPATAHSLLVSAGGVKSLGGAMSDPQPGETIPKGNPSTNAAGAAAGAVQSLTGLA